MQTAKKARTRIGKASMFANTLDRERYLGTVDQLRKRWTDLGAAMICVHRESRSVTACDIEHCLKCSCLLWAVGWQAQIQEKVRPFSDIMRAPREICLKYYSGKSLFLGFQVPRHGFLYSNNIYLLYKIPPFFIERSELVWIRAWLIHFVKKIYIYKRTNERTKEKTKGRTDGRMDRWDG